jgi:hypothetical protein
MCHKDKNIFVLKTNSPIFAIENEAIHNKDYSVVKTSRAGLRTRSFFMGKPQKS